MAATESPEGPQIDRDAAERVHYTDPRVRLLASTRWRLATGYTHRSWLALGKDNPDALIREARDWLRAAVAAGLLPAQNDEFDDEFGPYLNEALKDQAFRAAYEEAPDA